MRGAFRRRHEAGKYAHRRRLARAIWPKEANDLPFFDLERDVVNRDVAGVSLGETFDFDHSVFCKLGKRTPDGERLVRQSL